MPFFRPLFLFITLLQTTCFSLFAQGNKQSVQNWNAKQPSRFTENKGQVTDQNGKLRNDVKYIYYAPGFKAIFKANSFSYEVFTVEKKPEQQEMSEATGKAINENLFPDKYKKLDDITIKTCRIDIELPGANKNPQIIEKEKSADYKNYYTSTTSVNGIQRVYRYTTLTYKNVWPNIDLVFYARKEGELKYDIVVHPGGELEKASFAYDGIENIQHKNGKLDIKTALGSISESIPVSFLKENKEKIPVTYSQKGNKVGFKGNYDKTQTLVVDPVINWATYLGGYSSEEGRAVNTDKSGNIYITGSTSSNSNFATSGAHQSKSHTIPEAFLVKFNKNGIRLWATYYGGNRDETGYSVVIDMADNIYMSGATYSESGIATPGAYKTDLFYNAFYNGFIAKFDSSGKRIWGTYLQDGPIYSSILDSSANLYVVGQGSNTSAIIFKFDSAGVYKWDTGYYNSKGLVFNAITIDENENFYVTGFTYGGEFQTPSSSHQPLYGGGIADAYIIKYDNKFKTEWATYYGGSDNDRGYGVVVDKSKNVYVTGSTKSSSAIASYNVYDKTLNGNVDGFIVKFNASGQRQWGTYFGGDGDEVIYSAILNFNKLYITGYTDSHKSIATPDGFDTSHGANSVSVQKDAFIAAFTEMGEKEWGTYYGGAGTDYGYSLTKSSSGSMFLTGATSSITGIATTNSFQSTVRSSDMFLLNFELAQPDGGIFSVDSLNEYYCGNTNKDILIRIKNYSKQLNIDSIYIGWSINGSQQTSLKYAKIINKEDTSEFIKLGNVALINGLNTIKIWTYKPNGKTDGNINNDSLIKQITINPLPNLSIQETVFERNVKFKVSDSSYAAYKWSFGDGDLSGDANPFHRYPAIGKYNVNLTVTSSSGCKQSFTHSIQILTNSISNYPVGNADVKVYPNPFTEESSVEYFLDKSSEVEIKLYDISGRELLIKSTTLQSSGKHTLIIDSEKLNLTSGLYLLNLEINGLPVNRKIIKLE